MKNIFTHVNYFLFLITTITLGQSRVFNEINKYKKIGAPFEKINILELKENHNNFQNSEIVHSASYAFVKTSELEKIVNNNYQTIEIRIPYKNEMIDIELYRVNLFSDGFKLNTDKLININYKRGFYYRGTIKGNKNSIAAFNFFENEMNGIVSSKKYGNINIGKLLNQTEYIIYSDNDLLTKSQFTCRTTDGLNKNHSNEVLNRTISTEKCVTSYFEVGYQAYNENGNNIVATTNWITSIFNISQTLFDNDGISISLKTIFIWTVDDYFSTSSNFILPAFANARPTFNGDIGFIADIDPAALGGQASNISGLCNDKKFAYGDLLLDFDNIPTFSQPVYVVTHELGHVLGSHHTHACVWNGNNTAIDGCSTSYGGCATPETPTGTLGTIMSYCFPDFSLGFGEQPANAIIQHINSSSCIGTNCSNNCINTIGFINVFNVTQHGAIINWNDSDTSNSQWNISVVPFGSEPNWTAVGTNTFSLSQLNPNSYYEVTLKGNCTSNLNYPKHSLIFATQGDNCDGTIIYDTGGLTQGYSGNEHIIRTIMPTVPNKKIKLTFNNLNLSPWEGWLFIYDGLNTSGSLLNLLTTNGSFLSYGFGNSFNPSGNSFESQDSSGALTLEFVSSQEFSFNQIANNTGWKATISCLDNLGNNDYGDGYFDYSYSINPISQQLNIASKDFINKVEIYSIDGKLVMSKNDFGKDFFIDLSTLSSNVYITKLIFEKGLTTFKIVKQ